MFGNSESDDVIAFGTLAMLILIPTLIVVIVVFAWVTDRGVEHRKSDDAKKDQE